MIETLDFKILDAIQLYIRNDILDAILTFITRLGDKGILWIAITIFLIASVRHRTCGIQMAAGLITGLITCNLLLKNLLARARPCWINTGVDMLIDIPQDYSFPSGHTVASFVSAVILLRYDRRYGIPAMVIAVLIAFSRLYLYVHFPTDVLAGALLGTAIGLIIPYACTHVPCSAWHRSPVSSEEQDGRF